MERKTYEAYIPNLGHNVTIFAHDEKEALEEAASLNFSLCDSVLIDQIRNVDDIKVVERSMKNG